MMRMGSIAWLLVLSSAATASAQGEIARRDDAREAWVLQAERREVTALYASGVSICTMATAMAIFGGLTMGGGDVVGVGVIPLFALPAVAPVGLILLSLAIGYDIGLIHWDRARILGDRVSAQRALSEVITWTYAVGAGVVVASAIASSVVASFAPAFAFIPAIVGGLGFATVFVGAGMDIAAGAWSGFQLSVAPSADGVRGVLSGRF